MAVVLFDIDNTLLYTGGRGGESLKRAFEQIYGRDLMQGIEVSGKTDPMIVLEAVRHHLGREADEKEIARLLDLYLEFYGQIAADTTGGHVKPGVVELLERLTRHGGFHVGLLTGNMERGADLKLKTFGLDGYFGFGAYGSDDPDRNKLVPAALEKLSAILGWPVPAGPHVVVIGDTARDVECARPAGARAIAVASGWYDCEHLAQANPDLLVEDLQRGADKVWELLLIAHGDFNRLIG